MPRGRKPRTVTCQPPPRGVYLVDWTVNILFQRGALNGQALVLWLHLKGLAWQRGECDPTDAILADLMGGIKHDLIRIIRRTLEANDLLYEYQRDGVRWLVPLPASADTRGNFAPGVWTRVADRQGRLAERVVRLEQEPTPERQQSRDGRLVQAANSPPGELGANSIGGQLLKEEEELVNAHEERSPHPLTLTTPMRRAGERGAERGATGNGIHPHPNWGPIQMGPNSAGGQLPPGITEGMVDDYQTLCNFMSGHGVFASIARTLAPQYLARMNVQEAQAEVLGWVISIRESKDVRDGKIDAEMARGRLVARLREGTAPPAEALDQAWDALEEIGAALDRVTGSGEPGAETDASDEIEDDSGDTSESEQVEAQEGPDDDADDSEERTLSMPVWTVNVGGREATLSAEAVWDLVRSGLMGQMARSTYDLYLRSSFCLGVDEEDGTMVVAVGYQFAAEWLNHQPGIHNLICRSLRRLWPEATDIRFEEQ
jgi:hypothetical protein